MYQQDGFRLKGLVGTYWACVPVDVLFAILPNIARAKSCLRPDLSSHHAIMHLFTVIPKRSP